ALLTAAERLIFPKRVTPEDLKAAREKPISRLTAAELSSDLSVFGAAGSPTRVERIYSVESKRAAVMIPAEDPDAAAAELVRRLSEKGLFGRWQGEADQTRKEVIRHREIHDPEKAVWVVAESYGGNLRPVTFELLGKGLELASQLRSELVAVLIGNSVPAPGRILGSSGADRVLLLDHPALREYSSEGYSQALVAAIEKERPFVILVPATADGRDFAPRVAARLGLGLTGDCVGLELNSEGRLVQLKPAFGGNIVAPIVSRTDPQMATMRPGILKAPASVEGREAPVEKFTPDLKPVSTRLVR
ncbi:MAG: electron transfer flavoprotein alpha/ beta subunit, partial [Candidatus Tectomicrobia bacterium]|nr:electron transfer flavoprotein alpha/ beta subunit [Candidatus Tectomicrobia bacterium]